MGSGPSSWNWLARRLSTAAGAVVCLLTVGCGPETSAIPVPPASPVARGVPAESPLSPEHEAAFRQAVELGMEHLRSGRHGEAALELSKAIAYRPRNPVVLRMLGSAHAYNNDLQRARRSFEESIRLDPSVAGTHFELGQVALATGDLDLALHEAQRTVALDPENPLARELLGTVQYRRGDLEAALESMTGVLARNSSRQEALLIAGLCHQQMERFEEARQALLQVVEKDPAHAEAQFNLGKVLGILGDEEGAERANAAFLALQDQGAGNPVGNGL